MQLTILLYGEMNYQVNDMVYPLHKGEGIFCRIITQKKSPWQI